MKRREITHWQRIAWHEESWHCSVTSDAKRWTMKMSVYSSHNIHTLLYVWLHRNDCILPCTISNDLSFSLSVLFTRLNSFSPLMPTFLEYFHLCDLLPITAAWARTTFIRTHETISSCVSPCEYTLYSYDKRQQTKHNRIKFRSMTSSLCARVCIKW